MANTKRTKSSKISAKKKTAKTPTTKVNNFPELIQWVLGFLNLRSTPGKQNINKLPADVRKELKCPPLHPSKQQIPLEEKLQILEGDSAELKKAAKKLQDKTLSTREWYKHQKKVETYVDDEGNVFDRKTKKFLGIEQCNPTLEDFKQFFLKEGIPPKKGSELLLENGQSLKSLDTKVKYPETWYTPTPNDYPFELKLYIIISELLWAELLQILGNMVHDTKTYDNKGSADESFNSFRKNIKNKYEKCLEDDEIPDKGGYSENFKTDFRGIKEIIEDGISGDDTFPHYGMLPQAIYACILDFSYNHKEMLSQLKQCPCCGTFFQPKQRGRPNDYCSDDCKEVFNRKSRKTDKALKASSRKRIKQVTMQVAKKEIIDWICNLPDSPFSRKEAEDEYEKERKKNPDNVASLKAFQNSYGRRFGLLNQFNNTKG